MWGSDGYLLFLGRKERGGGGERGGEVKVRGQRVDLGGVGGLVGGVVREMVEERGGSGGVVCEGFVVKQPQTGSLALCCVVVLGTEKEGELTSEGVVRRCGKVLPSHLVPSLVLFLPSLPLTLNGKLNKKELEERAMRAFASSMLASTSAPSLLSSSSTAKSASSPSTPSPIVPSYSSTSLLIPPSTSPSPLSPSSSPPSVNSPSPLASSPSPSPLLPPSTPSSTLSFSLSHKKFTKVVTDTWTHVLGESNNNYQDTDNFFSVGGDSLLAIFIVSHMKSLAEQAEEREEEREEERKTGKKLQKEDKDELNEEEREAIFSFLVYDFLECLTIKNTVEWLMGKLEEGEEEEEKKVLTNTISISQTTTTLPISGVGRMYLKLCCPHQNHYNQGVTLLIPTKWRKRGGKGGERVVEMAVRELVELHPLLGAVLIGGDDNEEWFFSFSSEGRKENLVRVVEGWKGEEEELERVGGELHSSLNPFAGKLFGVGYFLREGEREKDVLIMVGHHLVVDAFSWEIICQNFTEICTALVEGKKRGGRKERDGYKEWAEGNKEGRWAGRGVEAMTQSVVLQERMDILDPFVKRNGEGERKGEKSRYSAVELSVPLSSSLALPPLREMEAQFALSTASSLVSFGGNDNFVLWMEGNGRNIPSLDLSGAVGWFTSVYPLIFSKEEVSVRGSGNVERMLERMKEGKELLSLELWKWLEDNNKCLKKFSILLNFLAGRGGKMEKDDGVERMEGVVHGAPFHPQGNHFFDIYIGMSFLPSPSPSLHLNLIFDTHKFSPKKMKKFSAHLLQTFSNSLTASPLPPPPSLSSPVPLCNQHYPLTPTQQAMFLFSTSSPSSSSPSPSSSPLYVSHALFALEGPKVTTLKIQKMFNFLWARHDSLRLFPSSSSSSSIQDGQYCSLYSPSTPPPIHSLFLERGERREGGEGGEGEVGRVLERVLERGLGEELGECEGKRMYFGMGLVVVEERKKEGEKEKQFLFVRYHHALLDGWSLSLLLSEMLVFLNDSSSPSLPPTPSFLSYLSWHSSLDQENNITFWKKSLCPPLPPTLLKDCLIPSSSPSPSPCQSLCSSLPGSVVKNVEEICKKAGLLIILIYFLFQIVSLIINSSFYFSLGISIASFLQAAWVCVLGRYTGDNEVMFGLTTSGRDITGKEKSQKTNNKNQTKEEKKRERQRQREKAFENSQNLVGLLVRTIPVRYPFPDSSPASSSSLSVGEFLQDIHKKSTQFLRHSALSLQEIIVENEHLRGEKEERGGEGGGRGGLNFDTLLVIENIPFPTNNNNNDNNNEDTITVTSMTGDEHTEFSLTPVVSWDHLGLYFKFLYRDTTGQTQSIVEVSRAFLKVVEWLSQLSHFDLPLFCLEIMSEEEKQDLVRAGGRSLGGEFGKVLMGDSSISSICPSLSSSSSLLRALLIANGEGRRKDRGEVVGGENRAIVQKGKMIHTHSSLLSRSSQISHFFLSYLEEQKERKGEVLIGIRGRGVVGVEAVVSCVVAGVGCVLVDPGWPAKRVKEMLSGDGGESGWKVRFLVSYEGKELNHLLGPPFASFHDSLFLYQIPSSTPSLTQTPSPSSLFSTSPPSPLCPFPFFYLFTSGTTGTPKIVKISHDSILRLSQQSPSSPLFLSPSSVFVHHSSLSFDASLLEIFLPLLSGASILVPSSPSLSLSPSLFSQEWKEGGATHMWLTSGLFSSLSSFSASLFSSLTTLFVGGDVLSLKAVRSVLKAIELEKDEGRGEKFRLVNGYGPTENTTFTCLHEISLSDLPAPSPSPSLSTSLPIPVGTPLEGGIVVVLDERGRMVRKGGKGWLCVGGLGLSEGYVERERRKEGEKKMSPFWEWERRGEEGKVRLYNTGDWCGLGESKGDKEKEVFFFFGRGKGKQGSGLVKVRGNRLSPYEVEKEIEPLLPAPSLESSYSVVVVACSSSSSPSSPNDLLVAIISGGNTTSSPSSPITFSPLPFPNPSLSSSLPPYMVPSLFLLSSSLPLTTSGKIDRKKLTYLVNEALTSSLSSSLSSLSSPSSLSPSSSPILSTLIEIWKKILPFSVKKSYNLSDNFFSCGGHSLLVGVVVGMVEEEWGIRIGITEFGSGRLGELVEVVERKVREKEKPRQEKEIFTEEKIQAPSSPSSPSCSSSHSFPALPTLPSSLSTHPLSTSQKRMWFLHHLSPLSTNYNITVPFSVSLSSSSPFSLPLFALSLHILTASHPILRTSFPSSSEGPVQKVHSLLSLPSPFYVQTKKNMGENEREKGKEKEEGWEEEEVENWVKKQQLWRFDLENEVPLFKIFLFLKEEKRGKETIGTKMDKLWRFFAESVEGNLSERNRNEIGEEIDEEIGEEFEGELGKKMSELWGSVPRWGRENEKEKKRKRESGKESERWGDVKENFLMGFVFHHVIMDEVSLSFFFSELSRLYEKLLACWEKEPSSAASIALPSFLSSTATLSPLHHSLSLSTSPSIPYSLYSHWESLLTSSPSFSSSLSFFHSLLLHAPTTPLPLPLDFPRDKTDRKEEGKGNNITLSLPLPLIQDILSALSSLSTSLFLFSLSSFALFLSSLCGDLEEGIVIGTPVSNRPLSPLSQTLGCFTNTLPLLLHPPLLSSPSSSPSSLTPSSFQSFLRRSHETLLSSLSHQHVPLHSILSSLNLHTHSPTTTPLFQALFSEQVIIISCYFYFLVPSSFFPSTSQTLSTEGSNLIGGGENCVFSPISVPSCTAKTDLSVTLIRGPPSASSSVPFSLSVDMEYDTALFKEETGFFEFDFFPFFVFF